MPSGGYDTTVRLFDVQKGVQLHALRGHDLSVSSVLFNLAGNLIVSGGKDASVRFWDVRSGLCIKNLRSHLGEVRGPAPRHEHIS